MWNIYVSEEMEIYLSEKLDGELKNNGFEDERIYVASFMGIPQFDVKVRELSKMEDFNDQRKPTRRNSEESRLRSK